MAVTAPADPGQLVELIDLTAIDVVKVHPRLNRVACQEALHLVEADGQIWAGFDALVRIGRWFPLFWPLGMISVAPGVTWLGRRAYNGLAVGRHGHAGTPATPGHA